MTGSIRVTRSVTEVVLCSPYHPDVPAAARKLGGKWDAATKSWRFDVRDESRVRELCRNVYGTDGSAADAADLVTVRLTLKRSVEEHTSAIYFAGREVCGARGRDSGARLGPGVVLLEGRITSTGSAKNWYTSAEAGSVFEIRDLPRSHVPLSDSDWIVEIVDPCSPLDAARLRLATLEAAVAEARAEVDRLAGDASV